MILCLTPVIFSFLLEFITYTFFYISIILLIFLILIKFRLSYNADSIY